MKRQFLCIYILFFMPFFIIKNLHGSNISTFLEQEENTDLYTSQLEESLATKIQLLKMRINLMKEVQSVLSVIIKDPTNDELSKHMTILSVHERQITALKDYINNPYVGETAIRLINFYQDLRSGDEIADEYSKLYKEIESEIKMAKAMGILVDKYESDLFMYSLNALMVAFQISLLT